MSSLIECFSIIRDPRQESKIDHELINILILCVLAVYYQQQLMAYKGNLKVFCITEQNSLIID